MIAWRPYRIADLGRVVTGKTPPSSRPELFDGTIPFITPSDMSFDNRDISTERFVSADWDDNRRTLLPEGAVCVVCIGATIGKICMASKPSQTNQQVNSVIVDRTRFDPAFVYYVLRTRVDELIVRAAGAATPIVNKTAFSEIEIEAPPLETQRRIASILGAYDDLIEVNRRRIAVLEEMARGLFEERARNVESMRLLFDVAEVGYGKNLPKSQLISDAPYAVYGASKVIGRYSQFTHVERVIVVGCRGTVGRFQVSQPNSFITNNSFAIEPRDARDFAWIFFALRKRGLWDVVSGSAQPQITLEGAARVEIAFPDQPIRADFSDMALPMMKAGWGLLETIQHLADSRDLLLPRLTSGQLAVTDAERGLEDAT